MRGTPIIGLSFIHACRTVQIWKESGFDVRVAEQLLEGSIRKRWEKKERSEAVRLQAELLGLVRGCRSVTELALAVREAAKLMNPRTLVAAIGRAAHLPLVSPPCDSTDLIEADDAHL